MLGLSCLMLLGCEGHHAGANGTTIPSATKIIDRSGNVWTVAAGKIYQNGCHAGSSDNTSLLLYYHSVLFTENNQGNWWFWNGRGFVTTSGDPRIAGSAGVPAASSRSASASGTTIPSAARIIDSSGNVWTVAGGAIYLNGAHAASSANTALLLYYNCVIFTQNQQGNWWSWNGSGFVYASGDPRAARGVGVTRAAATHF
jgi:hypothetical protein